MLKLIMSTLHSDYNSKSIAIIMCTKNGAEYIEEQLYSVSKQIHKNMDIYILDNDSGDKTVTLIKRFKKNNKYLKVFFVEGNDSHYANSFINLTQMIKKYYDYYAFCDQDDVWDSCHTQRAIKKIENTSLNIPAMYCSRTNLINKQGLEIGKSKLFNKKPSFNNALVQSIAGGNTMVFNRLAFNLLGGVKSEKNFIPSHDWMLYLIVSGCGGRVYYNKQPSVSYRQHENNAIGSNLGIINTLKRANLIFNGAWSSWLDSNYEVLKNISELTQENLSHLENFHRLRKIDNVFIRLKEYFQSSIYRQTFLGNLSMSIALIIKKL